MAKWFARQEILPHNLRLEECRFNGVLALRILRIENNAALRVAWFPVACIPSDQRSEKEMNMVLKFLKKALSGISSRPGGHPAECSWLAKEYPALCEFLTATEDEGKARQTSTLLIFAQDGAFKMTLNDRQTKHSLWVTADTCKACFQLLEADLVSGEGQWRKNPEWQQKGGKK